MDNKPSTRSSTQAYWRANLRLVAICLVVWFLVSYVFGILLVDELNRWRFFGFKLGFWFAQQGSIYVFLVLIFWYAWRMNRLDREFGVDETDEDEDAC
jgi:putative solute:sodium symporter small subunit